MFNKRGFTIIELLVVIAIIGILASIVLTSLSGAKGKARDSRRVADIKSIQLALSLYYNDNLMYPKNIYALSSAGSPPNNGLAGGYLSPVPTDPSYTNNCGTAGTDPSCYRYVALTASASPACNSTTNIPGQYHLGAILEESTNQALGGDIDQNSNSATLAGYFAGFKTCTGSGTAGFNGISTTCAASDTNSTDTCFDQKP